MSKLVGTWKLDSSDNNWDEYMKTIGKLLLNIHSKLFYDKASKHKLLTEGNS